MPVNKQTTGCANQNKQNGRPCCDNELIQWLENGIKTLFVVLTGKKCSYYVKLCVVSFKLNTTFTII